MNTVAKNEDLFSDFFQVGGYKNIAGVPANLISRNGGGSNKKLSELALMGNSNPFTKITGQKFKEALLQTKTMTGLSTAQVDDLYLDYRIEGNKELSKFPDWAVERSGTGNVYKEQIVSDIEDMAVDVPEPVVSTPPKKPMSTTNMLYIGLGVLALVGVTVLVVRRK